MTTPDASWSVPRRGLIKAAAWSAPVVVLAAAAPAAAASPGGDTIAVVDAAVESLAPGGGGALAYIGTTAVAAAVTGVDDTDDQTVYLTVALVGLPPDLEAPSVASVGPSWTLVDTEVDVPTSRVVFTFQYTANIGVVSGSGTTTTLYASIVDLRPAGDYTIEFGASSGPSNAQSAIVTVPHRIDRLIDRLEIVDFDGGEIDLAWSGYATLRNDWGRDDIPAGTAVVVLVVRGGAGSFPSLQQTSDPLEWVMSWSSDAPSGDLHLTFVQNTPIPVGVVSTISWHLVATVSSPWNAALFLTPAAGGAVAATRTLTFFT